MGCDVGWFPSTALLSHSGWEGTLQRSAYIDSIRDTEFNNRIIFHYTENTGNDGVETDAVNLGNRDPNTGLAVAGEDGHTGAGQVFVAVSTAYSTNQAITWNLYSVCSCGPQPYEADLMTIGEHELGHALGLDHPTQGPNSGNVMECIIQSGEQLFGDPYSAAGTKWNYDWDYVGAQPIAKVC